MTCFLDTSAVVKLFVDEDGHEPVRALTQAPIVVADISIVELPAALYRKHRMGELSAHAARLLDRAFAAALDGQAPGLDIHLVSTEVALLRACADLVSRHPLRAYDAVQLGTALAASSALGGCSFGSFDVSLNEAAVAEGLPLAW